MCLYSKQKVPLIADKDIECYKNLIPVDGKLIAPTGISFLVQNSIVEDEAEEHIDEIFGTTEISSGFFHSFRTKERVIEEIKTLQRKLPKGTKLKVFKAIVPKGSAYYIGQRFDICSKALIIKE